MTKLTKHDQVIITPLTNNARYTNSGRHSTINETITTQTNIITYLTSIGFSRDNISFLEAPPLLPPSPQWLAKRGLKKPRFPTPDVFPYNQARNYLARNSGVQFAQTLVGEEHMFDDGYHILNRHRHLLHRSIAAAAAHVNPHAYYGFRRPPFGPYGPWASPRGVGLLPLPTVPPNNHQHFPSLPNFRDVALSHPFHFRSKI